MDPEVAAMSAFAVNNNSELASLTQQLLSISGATPLTWVEGIFGQVGSGVDSAVQPE
jgi:hypothetical protein